MKRSIVCLFSAIALVSLLISGCGLENKVKDKINEIQSTNTNNTNNTNNTPTTLSRVVSATDPIVGDWGTGVTSSSNFAISFYPNGRYITWDAGASAGTGVEYGTFTAAVSGNTVTVVVTSTLDDQGDNQANPNAASGLTEVAGQTKTMVLTLVDQNTIQTIQSDGTTVSLHRTVDANNPIVGSWGVGVTGNGSAPNSVLLVVFYANGTYIHYGNDSSATAHPGAEYGTYSYDSVTSTLTTTATVDRNGDQGLTNGNETGRNWWFKVNGDVLDVNDSEPAPIVITGIASINTTGTATPLAAMLITARHPADVDNFNPIAQTTTGANGSFTLNVPYGSDFYMNISGSTGGTPYAPFNTRIWRNVTQAPDFSIYALDAINPLPLADMNNMLNGLVCGSSPCSTTGITGKGWLALDAFDSGFNNKIAGVSYELSPSLGFFGYNDDSNGSTYTAPPTRTTTAASTVGMNGPSALAFNATATIVTVTISKSGSANQVYELPLVPGEVTYKQVGY